MNKKSKAIFLDRDGVINELVYFREEGISDSPNSADQFRLINGVGNALKNLKELGYKLIIISNQPGIVKGKYTLDEFSKIQQKMEWEIKQYNVILDDQFYCLHHPNAAIQEYQINCECRKPHTKLVLDAIKKHNIDIDKSFLMGDGMADMELAKKMNCRGIFIGNINSAISKLFKDKGMIPFYIAHDLHEASEYINKYYDN